MEYEWYERSSVPGDGYDVGETSSSRTDHGSSSQHSGKDQTGDKNTKKEKTSVETVREEKLFTKKLERSANEGVMEVAVAVFMLSVFAGAVIYYVFIAKDSSTESHLDPNVHRADLHLFSTEARNLSVTGPPSYPRRQCSGPKAICGKTPLLCTYSASASPLHWLAVPPQNYCSVIFYEALGYEGRDKLGSMPRSHRLNHFLRIARDRSPWPEFGVAFDYKYVIEARDLLRTARGVVALTDLFRFNVLHFGVLNAGTFTEYTVVHIKATLDLFKTLRQIQRQKADEDGSSSGGIVYGVKFMPPRRGNEFQLIDDIIKGSNIDWLVATTHLTGPDKGGDACRITGPTTWDEKFADYELPLKPTIEFLQNQSYLYLGIPVSVSFTLRGRWYTPRNPQDEENFKPGNPCIPIEQNDFTRYAQICKNPAFLQNVHQVDSHYFRYTYDKDKNLTYVFDDLGGIEQKVASAMMAHLWLNFAVFDVDFEYLTQGCLEHEDGYAAFDRVKAVRDRQGYYRVTTNPHDVNRIS